MGTCNHHAAARRRRLSRAVMQPLESRQMLTNVLPAPQPTDQYVNEPDGNLFFANGQTQVKLDLDQTVTLAANPVRVDNLTTLAQVPYANVSVATSAEAAG